MKLLVTGLSGLIGSALRAELGDRHDLHALNRTVIDGVRSTPARLEDFEAIRDAFTGRDVVVHLAAKIHDGVGWEALHATNVVGTRNVFQAAADAGVRRLVFASRGAVVAGWELEPPYADLVAGRYTGLGAVPLIDESMPTRPRNLYASTKVWGEALARHYADNHGLEVVCLRIGYAHAADRPLDARQFSVWNSLRDVVQAIRLSMIVSLPSRCEAFFVLSDNRYAYRSIERARRILGFEPMDAAEDHRV